MSCREKSKVQQKLKEMKTRAWRLALGGRKRLSGVSPRANADATSDQKKLKEIKLKEMKIRAWRLALGGRKPLSGVDLHYENSLAQTS